MWTRLTIMLIFNAQCSLRIQGRRARNQTHITYHHLLYHFVHVESYIKYGKMSIFLLYTLIKYITLIVLPFAHIYLFMYARYPSYKIWLPMYLVSLSSAYGGEWKKEKRKRNKVSKMNEWKKNDERKHQTDENRKTNT